jgi:hypothetical protein
LDLSLEIFLGQWVQVTFLGYVSDVLEGCLLAFGQILLALWGRKALALVDFGAAEWTIENWGCVKAMTPLRLAQWRTGRWLSLELFTTPLIVEINEIPSNLGVEVRRGRQAQIFLR